MARIGRSIFNEWNDGDVIRAKEYNREHEIIRTAINDNDTRIRNHQHDDRYIPREELEPYLQSGDTLVHYDVFVILESNRGDGTFSYYDKSGEEYIGELDEEGRPIFELSASYSPGNNHIEAYIDDTLHRSPASGGLIEIDETHVMLDEPKENGTEITFRYFQRVGMAEEYSVSFGRNTPRPSTGGTIWFKVVDG
mgnify:CR=1 FL=1